VDRKRAPVMRIESLRLDIGIRYSSGYSCGMQVGSLGTMPD
jgi:hypothetical protein